MKLTHGIGRLAGRRALLALAIVVTNIATNAHGEERKFTVLLAVPTKSVQGDIGDLQLPNANDIWDQYFDRTKPNVDSFAEWWSEISYGNVSVSGDVFGWVEIPWPVLPDGPNFTVPDTATDLESLIIPFFDLNATGTLDRFGGEVFNQNQQAILIDSNGDLPGTATPGFPPMVDVPTPGLVDFDLLTGKPVWTPGERFRDLNGDGRYDALLELARDGWGDPMCQGNGVIDGQEACDEDDDGQWDFPEPFEDFLVIYDPTATSVTSRWIKLDPSPNNTNAVSRAWAESYIRANYPGDADALIARCGNGKYDGPDAWTESTGPGAKMQQQPAGAMFLGNAVTPPPDSGLFPWSYRDWWEAYWIEKHRLVGIVPAPRTPKAPEWNERIPNLRPFDPADPSIGSLPGNTGDLRAFNPNAGGDTARRAQECSDGGTCDGTCTDDPPCPLCLPDDGGQSDCTPADVDPPSLGDGTIDGGSTGNITGDILPDMLDLNNDGIPDYYDGPAEFDDLPSSMYHSRNDSGLGYGGDGRPGEVTSVRGTDPWGQDIGSGDPNAAGGPDGVIPAGGPLAFNVHGAHGYDAGNVLNLEFLTWAKEPNAPITSLAFDDAGTLFGIDSGTDFLVTIDSADGAHSDVGAMGLGLPGIHALAFGNGTLYGIADVPTTDPPGPPFQLVRINTTTGVATPIGRIGNMFFPIEDMAFDSTANTLYAMVDFFGMSDLWTINTTTGDAAPVVRLGLPGIGAQGLAFDPDTGDLLTIDLAFEKLARVDLTIAPPCDSLTDPPYCNLVPIGPADPERFEFVLKAMAFGLPGLFAADISDRLISIDPGSGDATDVGLLGFSSSRSRVLKRDFNLDGLLDLGEVREAGTENYVIDANPGTANDGGSQSGDYPFNRRRLTEDVVAALDANVDWDPLVTRAAGANFLHSTVLLPAGLYRDGLAPGGRGLFQLPAPGMDLPIRVQENDLANPLSPILFSDFTTALGSTSETGQAIVDGSFAKGTMAHEWGHVWEGYPDLYDYDVYINGIENAPVCIWDIMAGGFVHPSPVLKQFFTGKPQFGTAHRPWIDLIDLADVLEPLEETQVAMPDYAFNPTGAVYVFQNPNLLGERFYFWRVTQVVPPDPNDVNFSRNAPGDGVMVMHTDFGNNFEALPLQQRIGTHSTYNIIQADGLQNLENNENCGDSGDPFPGTSGVFRTQGEWSADTDPNSNWWGQVQSGLSITDITQEPSQSFVTFLWQPRLVPEFRFLSPPGGFLVGNNYRIDYEAFDFFGGTQIRLFFDRDPSVRYDGTPIQAVPPQTNPLTKVPGVVRGTFNVPLASLPGDGDYFFYARMELGAGQDDMVDPPFSTPRAGLDNKGRGDVNVANVDATRSRFENWRLTCSDDSTAGSERWLVRGTVSGPQIAQAVTGMPYTTDDGQTTFTIDWNGIVNAQPTAQVSNDTDVDGDGLADFLLTELDPFFPGFTASEFKTGDVVRVVASAGGAVLGFHRIIAVLDLDFNGTAETLRLAQDAGSAAGVSYRVHSFTDGTATGGTPDTFSFLTTGLSAYSFPIKLLNGQIVPSVFPLIRFTFPNGEASPTEQRVPLTVRFDGLGSLDELGEVNTSLEYHWDFGDGDTGTAAVVEHTYLEPFSGTATVILTVTNPSSLISGSTTAQILVNPRDTDADGIPDDGDGSGVVGDHPCSGGNTIGCDDNCVDTPNADQADGDDGGVGDGIGDVCDNCPSIINPDQSDANADGTGDRCDPDVDGDGINEDGDGSGTAGDNPCVGGNTVNCDDNCPDVANPDQLDADSDGVGDSCDICPNGSNPMPTIVATPGATVCSGTTVTLDAGTGFSGYVWSPGGETTQSIQVTTGGTYAVTVTDGKGCQGQGNDSITVAVNDDPMPSIRATPGTTICNGAAVTLDAGTGFSDYSWSPGGETTQTIRVAAAGTYTVTVTDGDSCQGSNSVDVTVAIAPSLTILATPGASVCEGTEVTLDAGSGFSSYAWMPGSETTQTIRVTTEGTYSVSVTDANGCEASAEIVITFSPTPTVTIRVTHETGAEEGPATILDAGDLGPGTTYLWSPGGQTTRTIRVTQADTYGVALTSGTDCRGSGEIGLAVLTIEVTGQGHVNVPSGLYPAGGLFLLTAAPDAGWRFVQWTGDVDGAIPSASVVLDSNKSVVAVFEEIPGPPPPPTGPPGPNPGGGDTGAGGCGSPILPFGMLTLMAVPVLRRRYRRARRHKR